MDENKPLQKKITLITSEEKYQSKKSFIDLITSDEL